MLIYITIRVYNCTSVKFTLLWILWELILLLINFLSDWYSSKYYNIVVNGKYGKCKYFKRFPYADSCSFKCDQCIVFKCNITEHGCLTSFVRVSICLNLAFCTETTRVRDQFSCSYADCKKRLEEHRVCTSKTSVVYALKNGDLPSELVILENMNIFEDLVIFETNCLIWLLLPLLVN